MRHHSVRTFVVASPRCMRVRTHTARTNAEQRWIRYGQRHERLARHVRLLRTLWLHIYCVHLRVPGNHTVHPRVLRHYSHGVQCVEELLLQRRCDHDPACGARLYGGTHASVDNRVALSH